MNTKPIPDIHLRLAALVREIEAGMTGTGHEQSCRTTFSDLADALEKHSFRLAVLGPWNSGKSCLINRLLGEEPVGGLLPVADKPTTAKITVLKYGATPKVSIRHNDGSFSILAEGSAPCREAISREAVTKSDGDLLVDWPADLLKAGGELIDTPGLFDPNEETSIVTLEALARFHGVIFVVPAEMPVDEAILKFLEDRLTRQTSAKFFYLVNKIDNMQPEDGRVDDHVNWCYETICERLSQEVRGTHFPHRSTQELVDRSRFFGVSGRYGKGLNDVWAALQSYLQNDRFMDLARVGGGKVDIVLATLTSAMEAAETAKFAKASHLEAILNEAKDYKTILTQQIEVTAAGVEAAFNRLVVSNEKYVRSLIDSLCEQGNEGLRIRFLQKLIRPDNIRRELQGMQRSLFETAQDKMDKIERQLKADILKLIEDCNRNSIQNLRNSIFGFAERLDTELEAARLAQQKSISLQRPDGAAAGVALEDGESVKGRLAAAGTGVAAGVGLAYATGAVGVWTTSWVASTAATWVPFWIANSLGMVATASMSGVYVSTMGLAACLGGPITASIFVLLGVINYRKATRAEHNFKKFLNKDLAGSSPKIIETMKSELKLISDGLVAGLQDDLWGAYARLLEAGETLVAAAKGTSGPEGTPALHLQLGSWRMKNDALKEELKPKI